MSSGGYFFKPLIVFPAQFADVPGGTLFQLGMICFVPSHKGVKGLELAPAHKLLFGRLRQKAAALPAADYLVYLLHQIVGKHNMCPSVHNVRGLPIRVGLAMPTESLTCRGSDNGSTGLLPI